MLSQTRLIEAIQTELKISVWKRTVILRKTLRANPSQMEQISKGRSHSDQVHLKEIHFTT